MAGKLEYEVSQTAYIKLLLHALKHPAAPVSGLLLGTAPSKHPGIAASGESSGRDLAASGSKVLIEDAVPLFHSKMGLAPMLELAFAQVDAYCQQQGGGLHILGSYHGNENHEDRELGAPARRGADSVARHAPLACALLVDNQLLAEAVVSKVSQPALELYTCEGTNTWRRPPGALLRLREATAPGVLLEYVKEERYRQVADFDDHLEDISKDWLNPDLFK